MAHFITNRQSVSAPKGPSSVAQVEYQTEHFKGWSSAFNIAIVMHELDAAREV